MANVLFKRGLHSQLPVNNAVEGTFYLTTDTDRFYVGKSDKTLAELNKSIRSVADYDALPSLNSGQVAVGDFYYLEEEVVLATCILKNGEKYWQQININTDTQIDDVLFTQEDKSNAETPSETQIDITEIIKFKDRQGDPLPEGDNKTATFTVKGKDGVKVSSASLENGAPIITFEGDYGQSVGENNTETNTANIYLTTGSGDKLNEDAPIKIKGGANVSVEVEDDDKITISSSYIYADSGEITLHKKNSDNSITPDGKIYLTLKDQHGDTLIDSISTDPIYYTLGDNTTIKYIPGEALPVYTKTEVNRLFNELNGLTYKGVVGSLTGTRPTLPTITDKIKNGDMYLVSGELSAVSNVHVAGKTGDLFIATGTESTSNDDSNAYITEDLVWTHVPSGNDTEIDTTYYAEVDTTNHIFELKDSHGDAQGKIDLDASTAIVLTSVASDDKKELKTTIAHSDIDTTYPDKIMTPTDVSTSTIVTGIEVNDQGHVTEVRTAFVEGSVLTGYDLIGSKIINESNVTLEHKLVDGNDDEHGSITEKITSSSLKFAEVKETTEEGQSVTAGFSINLEWGSFQDNNN